MSLASGTRLGPYEIQSPVGAGGMGEVYRARDTRLDRTVAVKILSSSLASTPDLKARFEREARAVAQLQHPNICVLHDVGHDSGTDFLVMEFLEGETLASRLKSGALPLPQVLKIATEIADALDRAHRAGIIHRDLKPGNIMLTKSGAKLLDFGLAKPASLGAAAASGSAPLLSAAMTATSPSPQHSPLTQQGALVGTVQYMSPEQLQGLEADARSDCFAFGAVLFEMVTGRRPFEGKSQIKVASAILEDDPAPVRQLQPSAPAELERLVATCLEKDPERRVQCARDLKLLLVWMQEKSVAPRADVSKGSRTPWMLAAAVLLVSLAIVSTLWLRRPSAELTATYILPPDNTNFTLNLDDAAGPLVLSPDGRRVAFVAIGADGMRRIYVRSFDQLDAKPIEGTTNGIYPFWSYDGSSIGFAADGVLRRVRVEGGPAVDICHVDRFRGGSWGADGNILLAPDVSNGIFKVASSAGSTPVRITTVDAEQSTHRWPLLMPDGKHFLYFATNHSDPAPSPHHGIFFASLDGKENRKIVDSDSNARFSGGYLFWTQANSVLTQQFDPASGQLKGESQAIIAAIAENGSTWRAAFDVSDNGSLIYQAGVPGDTGTLVQYGPDLKPKTLPDSEGYTDVRVSPDGHHVAALTSKKGHDIWTFDLDKGTRLRTTYTYTTDGIAWSRDGKYLFFGTVGKPSRIVRKALDGSSPDKTIYESDSPIHVADVSPDGTRMLLARLAGKVTNWWLPLDGASEPKVIPDLTGNLAASFSPDGRWILFSSPESGRFELYVIHLDGSGRQELTTSGVNSARWSSDGKTIYASSLKNDLFAIPVTTNGNIVQTGTPKLLFSLGHVIPANFHSRIWDVSNDGKHFVVAASGERFDLSRAVLISDWRTRLKK